MSHYGYLPPTNPETGAFLSAEKLTAAIEEFQAFAGLNITGKFAHIIVQFYLIVLIVTAIVEICRNLSKFDSKHRAHTRVYRVTI